MADNGRKKYQSQTRRVAPRSRSKRLRETGTGATVRLRKEFGGEDEAPTRAAYRIWRELNGPGSGTDGYADVVVLADEVYQLTAEGDPAPEAPTKESRKGWSFGRPEVASGQVLWRSRRTVYGDGRMVFGDPEIVERGKWGSVTNARFQSTVFQRSPTAPATPTGGTYANPVPAGWSDGVPPGTAPVWMSSRWFGTGMGDTWSVPALMVDTQGTQTRWSEVSGDGDPGTPQSKPSAWSATATEDTVWMAVRTSEGGQWSAWQVVKVKGEKGAPLTYADFKAAGGLNDLAQSSALQSAVGDLLRGSSPYTIEFSPSVVAVVNKTGAAWTRTVTLIANRIAAMQSVAGGTWSVVGTEGTDVTASVTGNQLTVGGKASGGKVTVRFTGPDLSQVERTLSVGVAMVADGLPGGKGDPGKDMTYSDFVAGGGIGALAANTDLISGVKSGIDTSAFRSDIGVRIKSDVKDLLKGDSGFVALTKGEPGSKGDKGDKGDQGIQGLKGTDGISPHIGNDGYWYSGSTKLSVKAQGPTGPQGLQGPKGDQGLKGNDGAKGDKGDKGDKGLKGDTPVLSLNSSYQLLADGALVSSASLRGPQGIQGLKGDTGLQGPSGPQGPAGPTGPTGPQGKTFRPAWDGSTLTFTVSTDTSAVSVAGIAKTSDIPTKLSQLANDSGYSKFSGKYSDLIGPPSIPTKDTVANWGFATTAALDTKASLSDVQQAGFVKYANGKLTYCSGLTCSDLNISSASHNHDSVYAKISHTHSQYLTSHQSLANYVTTNTAQTITAIKNFSGRLRIIGSVGTPAYNSASALTFTENTNDAQAVSLVYTSYDSYRAPAGLKLMGAQGNEWFEAPRFIMSGGTASQVLMADGSVQTHWKAADVTSATSDNGMITPLAMNNWTSKTFVKKTGDTMSGALGVLGMRFEHSNEINANGIGGLCIGYRNTPGGVNLCRQNAPLTYGSAASTIWHAGNDGSGSGLDADLLDGLHLSDIRAYGYAMQDTWIDASSLNADTWYPVTIPLSRSSNTRIEVLVALDSGKKPAWSTHQAGFTVRLIWECQGNGWGTNNGVTRRVIESSCLYVSGNVMPVRGVGQLTNGSIEYVYVRGGGRYRFRTSHGAVPTLRTSTYTNHSQSVSPTTTVPAATNRNVAYVSDTVANANSLGGVAASGYLTGVAAGQSAASAASSFVCSISKSGQQVAFHSRPITDITGNLVTTNTAQTISGAKTFTSIFSPNWFRSTGNSGWYSETHGGGWYMTDSTWIRNYANKNLYMTSAIIRTDGELQVGGNGDKFRVTSAGKATMTCAEKEVLTINGSATTGAAINLNNNGKQGVFGMNSNGLWFQNLAGTNQPYIQLLNDGGFVLDKGTAGRFDILHDGNIYGFVPRVIYSACGKFQTSGYGFYPMEGALAATAVNVTFSIPKTNVIRITLGSAIYPVKRLRCTVETATWNSGLGLAMVGRTYGVCYLDSNGSGISNANTMVKYIDIYCVYNGALAAPVGYGCITIMLLPAIL